MTSRDVNARTRSERQLQERYCFQPPTRHQKILAELAKLRIPEPLSNLKAYQAFNSPDAVHERNRSVWKAKLGKDNTKVRDLKQLEPLSEKSSLPPLPDDLVDSQRRLQDDSMSIASSRKTTLKTIAVTCKPSLFVLMSLSEAEEDLLGCTDIPSVLQCLREVKNINFIYLTHAVAKSSTQYHYFNLKVVRFAEVDRNDYYTLSRNGCSHMVIGDEIEYMDLDRFEFEYRIYTSIREIRSFAHFRIWKAFICWRKTIRYTKVEKAKEFLRSNLFIANGSLRPALLNVREMCYRINELGLCRIEKNQTYSLPDFLNSQITQLREVSARLSEFRELVKEVVRSACRTALLEAGFMPDDYFIENTEDAELNTSANDIDELIKACKFGAKRLKIKPTVYDQDHPLVGYVMASLKSVITNVSHKREKLEGRINRLHSTTGHNYMMQAYDMNVYGESAEKMTYTEQANKRNHCRRLTCFIKLADYLIVSNLHSMAVNSLYTILSIFQEQAALTPNKRDIEALKLDAELVLNPEDLPSEGEILSAAHDDSAALNIPVMPEPEQVIEAEPAPVNVPFFAVEMALDSKSMKSLPSESQFLEATDELLRHFKDVVFTVKNLVPDTYFDAFTRPIINLHFEDKTCGLGPQLSVIFDDDAHLQAIMDKMRQSIHVTFEAVHSYVDTFDDILHFYINNQKVSVASLQEQRLDIQFYRKELANFHRQIQVISKIPLEKCLGMILVDTRAVKEQLIPSPQRCLECLHSIIPQNAQSEVKRLLQEAQDAEYTLSLEPSATIDFVTHLSFLSHITDRIENLEEEAEMVRNLFDLIHAFKVPVPAEDLATYQSLFPSIDRTKNAIDRAQAEREGHVEKFVAALDKDIAELMHDVRDLKQSLNNPMLLDINEDREKVIAELTRIREALDECLHKSSTYVGYQKTFKNKIEKLTGEPLEVEQNRFEELEDVVAELKLKQMLWNSLGEWNTLMSTWKVEPFDKLNAGDVNNTTMRFAKAVVQLEKNLPPNSVVPILKATVEEMKSKLPTIINLRNPSLKERHWAMIEEVLGQTFNAENPLTLQLLNTIAAFEHSEQFEEIAGMASSEANLESILKKVEDSWRNMEFMVLPYKDSKEVFILGGTDEIQQLWDDSNINISTISSSRHVGPIKPRVDEWQHQLELFGKTLDEWLQCQRSWLYLESIFSAPDIQRQLPSEAKSFMAVDRSFKETMRKVQKVPLAMRAGTMPNLLDVMRNNNALLEQIHRCLEAYLESKRVIFPRFYFLSNDELLEILAQTRNPLAVQPHLRKCFDAISKLEFGIDNAKHGEIQYSNDILAMLSPEGERVSLGKGLKARANVEDWLGKVEEAMFVNLRKELKQAITNFDSMSRSEWLTAHPNQIILTAEQLFWSRDITTILENVDSKAALENLRAYEQKCFENLNSLASMVRGELPKLVRSLLGALITIDVHSRDMVTDMVNAGVCTLKNFDWQRQLRYYWDVDANNCVVRMSISEYIYGYEYLGASPRLVITPLTDRCYLCLMGALQLDLGGAPAGPAGTGKTETTKDLAKSVATQCVVFNCSDGLDYKLMGRFFSGLAQSGAWCCFDEFNRIDIEVLSVIAQQLITIRNAKAAKVARFMFEGREIKLVPTCAAFITMNPGYAGRTELPDNLKALFRPISMMVPDYRLIAEVILYSEGFESSKKLAQKMTQMYKLCSEQLSQQDHYDFGMRALKSVLVMAGALKRENPEKPEDVVLMRALRDSNLPKFLKQDAILFKAILQDLFPGVVLPEHDYGRFKLEIENVLRGEGLQVVPSQVVKVIQFYETLLVRHGVMLVGPTGGGKTTVYCVLAKVLGNLKEAGLDAEHPDYQLVNTYVLNPKSITMGELYGEVNKLTLEWHDGLMANIVRQTCQDTSPTHQWVICDGPVDALWIENMNTVLDDNKMLCLANSERIKLTNYVHMLFEVQDLAVASPATVSRCGMVYIDPEELGWLPYVQTWLLSIQSEVGQATTEYLLSLFESYMDEMLKFCVNKCSALIPQVPIARVQTTCKLIESLLRDSDIATNLEPQKLHPTLAVAFAFSLVWGVGGPLVEREMDKVDAFVRSLLEECGDARLPQYGDVWGSYPDLMQRRMDSWERMVQPFIYNKEAPFFDMMVPTIDTVRYGFLFEKLLAVNQSVLFTGTTGVGKTVIARAGIQRIAYLHNYVPLFINFSAQTSSNRTQEMIEAKLEKRKKAHLGAPKGKRCILFVDDLNMPKQDTYFSQPPIELLRQYQGFGGFYDRDKLNWITISDVTLAAACGPPGGGRNPVTARLIRYFSVFCIPMPAETTLKHIFTVILNGFLQEFPQPMRDLGDSIVQAAVEIYTRLSAELLPTPAKSHYVFNLRDLSKCVQGMLQADSKGIRDKKSMNRLFYHEVQRVFHDRLINNEDKSYFHTILAEVAGRALDDVSTVFAGLLLQQVDPESFIQEPILFGDFQRMSVERQDRVYEELPRLDKLKSILEEYMGDYNLVLSKDVKLVFFLDAMEHVTRIARIIRQDRGNALLVGVGGTGKQSLTRLAAHINGCTCIQIELCRGYDYAAFHEDLRRLYHSAGMKNQPTVFLFTDNQIVVEEFLEDINNMLNSGEVPNLFEGEEFEVLVQGTRPAAKEAGIAEGNRDAIYEYCINRVRNNLHIVLCMSPVGSAFRSRCRMFPSLVNCCTIDWFVEWPEEALLSVAKSSFQEVDLGADEFKAKIATMCTTIHLTVANAATQFYEELKRYYYTTPTSYLELISLYLLMLKDKRKELEQRRDKFRNGLNKIHETNDVIVNMEGELTLMRPKLEQKQINTEKLMIKLAEDQEKADEVKARVEVDEKAASTKAQETQAIADDAKRDLDEALPALEAANKALDSLDKNDVSEIRVFNKPPPLVQTVMESVALMLGAKTDWATAKNLLGEANFLKRLKEYPKDEISESLLKKLKRYIDNPDFVPEVVEKTSRACKSMCMWVRALDLYARIFRTVEPKRARLNKAKDELAVVMDNLKEKQQALQKVEAEIAALKAEYDHSVKERKTLEQSLALTSARLKRAAQLTSALADEKGRWEIAVADYEAQINNVVGDVFVSAACVAYYGAFTNEFRARLVTKWLEKCAELEVPVSENASLFAVMGDALQLREWNAQGLPRDSVSTDNAVLVEQSKRWPLMIDPQEQANRWIRNRESANGLKITKLSDPGLLRTMENALRMGCPVLLEDVGEQLDPALEPILLRQTFVAGGRRLIRLGDTDVDYDKKFKLYITTKLANPHYLPEVAIKVTVVNFTVTPAGLEDQLLGEVVRLERPDLEKQRSELIVRINEDKTSLQNIENKILKLLFESEGNILDNEDLIATLKESKRTSSEINTRLSQAEVTEVKITATRSKYIPIAARGSVLYFVIVLLAEIDPMYQFSLKYFTSLFTLTIDKSPQSDNLDDRIRILLETTTIATYNNVARGLFEQHKLAFSFMLCCSIMRQSETLSAAEWNHFLLSQNTPERDRPDIPAQLSKFLTPIQWKNLVDLSDTLGGPFAELLSTVAEKDVSFTLNRMDSSSNMHVVIGGKRKKVDFNEKLTEFQKLLCIAAVKAEDLVQAIAVYVSSTLGSQFIEPPSINLALLYEDMSTVTPLVFVLSTGSDPMSQFQRFAKERSFLDNTRAVSLGQGQGPLAKKLMENAQKNGQWVFLQNCHLAASWMLELEESIKQTAENPEEIHPDYRLFLSSMPAKSFPVSILQNSVKVTNEPPKGLRANLKRALNEITTAFFETHYLTKKWTRLVFGLCFFHAVLLERKKFGPLGWNIRYEFSESDRECALLNLNMFCQGNEIPWDALTYITSEITYGGRVTDAWDQRCLRTILSRFFHEKTLSLDYTYSPSGIYHALDTLSLQEYRDYTDSLPLQEAPELFGLSENANLVFNWQETEKLVTTILNVQPRISGDSKEKSSDEVVYEMAEQILAKLPEKLDMEQARPDMFEEDSEGRINSLSTVLLQEVDRFNKLVLIIRSSLEELKKAVKGFVVMSEKLEMIYTAFLLNQVPKMWASSAYPSLKLLGNWVKDLVLRLDFFHHWIIHGPPVSFWLSGFFFPQGFLTGTLQNYARKYKFPIDHLSFEFRVLSQYRDQAVISQQLSTLKFGETLEIDAKTKIPEDGLLVHGLFMEGFRWDDRLKQITEPRLGEMLSPLPVMHMKPEMDFVPDPANYIAPLYKTSERAGVLSTTGMSTNFIVGVPLPTDRPSDYWISMASALITEISKEA